MDVRCERCRARYAIPDEQITAEGLVVRCTACGHTFRIRKKELFVTVPVTGEEAARAIPAHDAVAGAIPIATPAPAPPPAAALVLRSVDGTVRPVADLATLQRWIAERRAVREDEVSREGGPFTRLGLLPDLAPILGLVEAADRAARQPARADSVDPFGRAGLDEPPVQPLAPPRAGPPAAPAEGPLSASPRQPAAAPVPAAKAAAIAPAEEAKPLDDAELATVRRKRGPLGMVAAGALLAALAVAAWRFSPAEVAGPLPTVPPQEPAPEAGRPPDLAPVPVQPPAATPPPPENAPPGPLPEKRVAEKGATAPASEPPTGAAAEAPRKPAGVKARLAAARALRERGSTSQALDGYQRLLREEPENVEALTGRGLCYFELNQYGPAEASFQRALALAPDDPDATMGLAETYRQTGKRAEAAALYQRYLAAHPDGEEAAVARNALSQLKE